MRAIVGCVSAKCDIVGILGNHDSSEMAYALEDMGVRVLINDAAEIEREHDAISIIGVDDPYDYKCDDLECALAPVPTDRFKICWLMRLSYTKRRRKKAFTCIYVVTRTPARLEFPGSVR